LERKKTVKYVFSNTALGRTVELYTQVGLRSQRRPSHGRCVVEL